MINSIVFDIGQVLLSFDPDSYLIKKYDSEIALKLYWNIFKKAEWQLLDRGCIGYDDAVDAMCRRDAENEKNIRDIMKHWTEILVPVEDNIMVVKILKEKSYKLYLLSNFQHDAFLEVEKKYDFFKCFDGKVISAFAHYNKPESEIYKVLMEKYEILPENALFIDDMPENLVAAKKLGFNTFQYIPETKLLIDLKNLGIL